MEKTVYRNLQNGVIKRIEVVSLFLLKGELVQQIEAMTIEHADPITIGLDV